MAKGKAEKKTTSPAPPAKVEPEAQTSESISPMDRDWRDRPEKKVAIVGCSNTKDAAPYADKSWEIWAMNNSFVHTQRQDLWFEIHMLKKENGTFFRRELVRPGVFRWSAEFRGVTVNEYIKMLADLNIPVLMQQKWPEIPKSEAYPLKEILTRFGGYFTNTVSYMIALAIYHGATEIGCWGVDMATNSEYGPQRPSVEFFLGVAAGLQIKITTPPGADLLQTRFLYGFGEKEQEVWDAKMMNVLAGMDQRRQKAMQKYELMKKQIEQYTGGIEAIKEMQRVWSNFADTKIWSDKR